MVNAKLQRCLMVVSVLVMCGMASLTIGSIWLNSWLNAPLLLEADRVIVVKQGDSLSKIAYQLEKDTVLDQARLFSLYTRFAKKTRIEIGEYRLPQQTNKIQLLELLNSGEVIRYKTTLVEGKTLKQWMVTLSQNPNIVMTLSDRSYPEIIASLGLDVDHPEGWFFPDTYQFIGGTTDKELLIQAHQRMKLILAEQWESRSPDLPYKSAYEALIMASIVEKETGAAHERPEIAGVFVRRLNRGMRLQTDPTIIYGLGDSYKGNIRRKHLRQATPYNTYVIKGLPPTPIAMPGKEAIYAALHPKAGKSIFFVAKGDGTHYFSETLTEHNKAVRKYQITQRAKQYQSAPKASR